MQDRFNELVETDLPRFWDTKTKEMLYPVLEGKGIAYLVKYCRETEQLTPILIDEMLLNPRFIRMKPTGLKDKNGKLIYEGDILIFRDGLGDRYYKVKYLKDCCAFYIVACDNINNTNPLGLVKEFEVVGSIHENPELLG